MTCKLSDKCDNVFACNVLRPNVELLGCNFYKPKKPMNNEKWFCKLSTDEKARFFASNKMLNFDYQMWIEWLKDKHNDN